MRRDTGKDWISGRSCWSKTSVEKWFQFAFESIKPTDGMTVGTPPVYQGDAHDNPEPAREFGAP